MDPSHPPFRVFPALRTKTVDQKMWVIPIMIDGLDSRNGGTESGPPGHGAVSKDR